MHVCGSRFFAVGVGEGPDPLAMGDTLFVGRHSLSLARRGEGGVADAVGSRLAAHLARGARAMGEGLAQPDSSRMNG